MVLIGTGAGIAFFMLMASRSQDARHIAATAKTVVLADWLFTAPAVLLQLATGIGLMILLGYSFYASWFYAVIGLFVIIGCCWLPVVWIQYKIKHLAEQAQQSGEFSSAFWFWMRLWIALGIPAFITIMLMLYLMVFKPLAII